MKKNNNLGRFLLVLAIILWSFAQIYPPTSADLVQQFVARADSAQRDAAFDAIVKRVQPLQQARPDRAFANLLDAIGTNDIAKYFPSCKPRASSTPPPIS